MTTGIDLSAVVGGISIHTLRVEGDEELDARRDEVRQISIHTLRVEGDVIGFRQFPLRDISIHTLRVEGD